MNPAAHLYLYLSFASITASLPLGCTHTFTLYISMRQSNRTQVPVLEEAGFPPLLLVRRCTLWMCDESSAYSIMARCYLAACSLISSIYTVSCFFTSDLLSSERNRKIFLHYTRMCVSG